VGRGLAEKADAEDGVDASEDEEEEDARHHRCDGKGKGLQDPPQVVEFVQDAQHAEDAHSA
jgi:hypothetical protein